MSRVKLNRYSAHYETRASQTRYPLSAANAVAAIPQCVVPENCDEALCTVESEPAGRCTGGVVKVLWSKVREKVFKLATGALKRVINSSARSWMPAYALYATSTRSIFIA